MRAGQLDRSIELQDHTEQRDSNGDFSEKWETIAKLKARVRPVRAAEAFQSGRNLSEDFIVFTIRFRKDVNATQRILYKDKVYEIQAVQEYADRNSWLDITARNVV